MVVATQEMKLEMEALFGPYGLVILTVAECKGLEANDVILFNLLSTSTTTAAGDGAPVHRSSSSTNATSGDAAASCREMKQWCHPQRDLGLGSMKDINLNFTDKTKPGPVWNTKIKEFIVGVTRCKSQLVIVEEAQTFASETLEILLKIAPETVVEVVETHGIAGVGGGSSGVRETMKASAFTTSLLHKFAPLVDLIRSDPAALECHKAVATFPRASSSSAYEGQGRAYMEQARFGEAEKMFRLAGNLVSALWAKATGKRVAGEAIDAEHAVEKDLRQRRQLLEESAQTYLDYSEKRAADLVALEKVVGYGIEDVALINAERRRGYEAAAEILESLGEGKRAGDAWLQAAFLVDSYSASAAGAPKQKRESDARGGRLPPLRERYQAAQDVRKECPLTQVRNEDETRILVRASTCFEQGDDTQSAAACLWLGNQVSEALRHWRDANEFELSLKRASEACAASVQLDNAKRILRRSDEKSVAEVALEVVYDALDRGRAGREDEDQPQQGSAFEAFLRSQSDAHDAALKQQAAVMVSLLINEISAGGSPKNRPPKGRGVSRSSGLPTALDHLLSVMYRGGEILQFLTETGEYRLCELNYNGGNFLSLMLLLSLTQLHGYLSSFFFTPESATRTPTREAEIATLRDPRSGEILNHRYPSAFCQGLAAVLFGQLDVQSAAKATHGRQGSEARVGLDGLLNYVITRIAGPQHCNDNGRPLRRGNGQKTQAQEDKGLFDVEFNGHRLCLLSSFMAEDGDDDDDEQIVVGLHSEKAARDPWVEVSEERFYTQIALPNLLRLKASLLAASLQHFALIQKITLRGGRDACAAQCLLGKCPLANCYCTKFHMTDSAGKQIDLHRPGVLHSGSISLALRPVVFNGVKQAVEMATSLENKGVSKGAPPSTMVPDRRREDRGGRLRQGWGSLLRDVLRQSFTDYGATPEGDGDGITAGRTSLQVKERKSTRSAPSSSCSRPPVATDGDNDSHNDVARTSEFTIARIMQIRGALAFELRNVTDNEAFQRAAAAATDTDKILWHADAIRRELRAAVLDLEEACDPIVPLRTAASGILHEDGVLPRKKLQLVMKERASSLIAAAGEVRGGLLTHGEVMAIYRCLRFAGFPAAETQSFVDLGQLQRGRTAGKALRTKDAFVHVYCQHEADTMQMPSVIWPYANLTGKVLAIITR
eukprot:g17177.t1